MVSQTTSPSALVHPSTHPPQGWHLDDLACPAPSLQPHYRTFVTTAGRSAPVPRIGTLPLAVSAAWGPPLRRPGSCDWSPASRRQVLPFPASACDELTPPIHRTPPGPHTGSSPARGTCTKARAFIPRPGPAPVSVPSLIFRCVSSGSHTFVFSSHT